MLKERPQNLDFGKFIEDNIEGILEAFSQLYTEILHEDDDDDEDEEGKDEDEVGNFFALKELMKL